MSIIWREYKHEQVFHVRSREFLDFRSLPEDQRDTYALVGGHMCFGVHEYSPHPGRYFTILRDPYRRVLSYYYYMRSQPDNIWHQDAVNLSLAEYLEETRDPEVNNGQLRRLYGIDGFEVDYGKCKQEMLEYVKNQAVQNFSIIGLTERFYETVLLLSAVNNWKLVPFFNKNVTRKKPSSHTLDQHTKDIILKYNRYDLALYNFAEDRFNEAVKSSGNGFSAKVKIYKSINRIITGIYSTFFSEE